jgi:hypothetical protein
MSISSPSAFFDLFSRFTLVFLGVVASFVRILSGRRRNAQETQALIASGHSVTATITGVRAERSTSKALGSTVWDTSYLFSAVWRDPCTGQDVAFARRAVTRGRYAIGSPVTVYVDPYTSRRYVFAP